MLGGGAERYKSIALGHFWTKPSVTMEPLHIKSYTLFNVNK